MSNLFIVGIQSGIALGFLLGLLGGMAFAALLTVRHYRDARQMYKDAAAEWKGAREYRQAMSDPAGFYILQRAEADAALQDLCVPH